MRHGADRGLLREKIMGLGENLKAKILIDPMQPVMHALMAHPKISEKKLTR